MVGVRATSRRSQKACRAHTSRSSVRTRWTANVVARERPTLHSLRPFDGKRSPCALSGAQKNCGYRRNGSVLRIAARLAEQSVCRSRTVAERLLKSLRLTMEGQQGTRTFWVGRESAHRSLSSVQILYCEIAAAPCQSRSRRLP
jgi:hypothetical protein